MLTLIITCLMCIVLIASILFFPNLRWKNVSTFWIVALGGAVLLVVFKRIGFSEIAAGLTEDSSINPIKIVVLFLSMTVQSIFLDEVGLFKYCANKTLARSKDSQLKLFIYLYLIVSVLTVFTSNDIIILTFTPFICYFSKSAKINPIPFLFTEFVAANTWSMALIIGNPTNVYLASSNGIGFLEYTKVMALPTVFGGIAALLILFIVFRKNFKEPLSSQNEECRIEDKKLLIIGIVHLALCTAVLVVSSYIGIDMWLVTLGFAMSLFVVSTIYLFFSGKSFNILVNSIKRVPWELVPFVISMFVFVLCLEKEGISQRLGMALGEGLSVYKYGAASFLAANLVNNIPMSVLFGSVISSVHINSFLQALYATVIGSNIGAFFTPIGALAGIMWSGILKKHEIHFGFTTFILYGLIISVPTLLAALVGLAIVL